MKKFRNAMVAICLMICALALTACGGGQLSTEAGVSKKGYVATTKDEYTTFSSQLGTEEATDLKSYKMTYKMKGSSEIAGVKTEFDILLNGILTVDAEGKVNGVAMKFNSGKLTLEAYIVDGYQYAYYKNNKEVYKYKAAIPAEDLDTTLNNSEQMGDGILSSISGLLPLITENATLTDKITYKKAVKGDVTRFNVNYTQEKTSFDFYIENTKEKTTGAEFVVRNDNVTIKMALNKFDGSIKYPSFKNYQEVTTEKVDELGDSFTNSMETLFDVLRSILGGLMTT